MAERRAAPSSRTTEVWAAARREWRTGGSEGRAGGSGTRSRGFGRSVRDGQGSWGGAIPGGTWKSHVSSSLKLSCQFDVPFKRHRLFYVLQIGLNLFQGLLRRRQSCPPAGHGGRSSCELIPHCLHWHRDESAWCAASTVITRDLRSLHLASVV